MFVLCVRPRIMCHHTLMRGQSLSVTTFYHLAIRYTRSQVRYLPTKMLNSSQTDIIKSHVIPIYTARSENPESRPRTWFRKSNAAHHRHTIVRDRSSAEDNATYSQKHIPLVSNEIPVVRASCISGRQTLFNCTRVIQQSESIKIIAERCTG